MAKTRSRKRTPAKIIHLEPEQSPEEKKLGALRFQFKQLKANAMYGAGESAWMAEVTRLAGDNPTPEKWVEAAEKATTICDQCHGSGRYSWGACINGRMQHSGPCYRCRSSGRQGQADYKRNRFYDGHRHII